MERELDWIWKEMGVTIVLDMSENLVFEANLLNVRDVGLSQKE